MTDQSDSVSSQKRGGGPREYMQDFARGRTNLMCGSCGFNMRRDPDFGTEADGSLTEAYCSICYVDGAFAHDVANSAEFIERVAPAIAGRTRQSVGKVKLSLKKELPRLPRWR